MLSPRSINGYMVKLNEVFNLLVDDINLTQSPFSRIKKLEQSQEKREAFSPDELALIFEKANDFIRGLFTIGLYTGLREADICLLKWNEVNLAERLITRTTRKTQKEVMIPIMPPLAIFLQEQASKDESEYVLPEHAEMYEKNVSGISHRVKKFLEGINIITSKVPKGRTRAVSVKDVHSLRHSFCYYAGMHNVPLAVVQAVVGHMSPEMTKHYSMHANQQDIKNAFRDMNVDFSNNQTKEDKILQEKRTQLKQFIDTLPLDKVEYLLKKIND
ncbi:tyrosine-type recombinase/integrase [Lentisphaerota bacterium WC36G]|nr:tyrosine-type recombinase/integrase [Lentisphaerae bacterium WC36]